MSLTLKIALGVFLGAIAAFLAINAPAWIQQSRREGWYGEDRQAMASLTPDLAIQGCGKPQRDLIAVHPPSRFMYYKDSDALLEFGRSQGDGSWIFLSMHAGVWSPPFLLNGILMFDGTLVQGDDGQDNEAFKQVAHMPCLEKRSK